MITPERAEEIRKAILKAHGWYEAGKQLTAAEEAEINCIWDTLPGNTSFYNAVCYAAKGKHLKEKP